MSRAVTSSRISTVLALVALLLLGAGCGEGGEPGISASTESMEVLRSEVFADQPPGLMKLRFSLAEVPSKVELGEVLSGVVVVENPTQEEVGLRPCLGYVVAFGESSASVGSSQKWACDAAPRSLKAGESVRFDVGLLIPASDFDSKFTGRLSVTLKPGSATNEGVFLESELIRVE